MFSSNSGLVELHILATATTSTSALHQADWGLFLPTILPPAVPYALGAFFDKDRFVPWWLPCASPQTSEEFVGSVHVATLLIEDFRKVGNAIEEIDRRGDRVRGSEMWCMEVLERLAQKEVLEGVDWTWVRTQMDERLAGARNGVTKHEPRNYERRRTY